MSRYAATPADVPAVTADNAALSMPPEALPSRAAGPRRYLIDASDLRLPPGRLPRQLQTTLGDGSPFFLQYSDRDDGTARYAQLGGSALILDVLPD